MAWHSIPSFYHSIPLLGIVLLARLRHAIVWEVGGRNADAAFGGWEVEEGGRWRLPSANTVRTNIMAFRECSASYYHPSIPIWLLTNHPLTYLAFPLTSPLTIWTSNCREHRDNTHRSHCLPGQKRASAPPCAPSSSSTLSSSPSPLALRWAFCWASSRIVQPRARDLCSGPKTQQTRQIPLVLVVADHRRRATMA